LIALLFFLGDAFEAILAALMVFFWCFIASQVSFQAAISIAFLAFAIVAFSL
jgi:hypothetical protein